MAFLDSLRVTRPSRSVGTILSVRSSLAIPADLVTSTPNRDSVINHTVLALAALVCSVRLPVCHSFQTGLARRAQRILLDKTVVAVGDVLPWVTQVLHVRL